VNQSTSFDQARPVRQAPRCFGSSAGPAAQSICILSDAPLTNGAEVNAVLMVLLMRIVKPCNGTDAGDLPHLPRANRHG
jgi:hypothetical protein